MNRGEDFNFWPSVADMFLSVFLVMFILWFATKVQFTKQKGTSAAAARLATEHLHALDRENARLKLELEKFRNDLADRRTEVNRLTAQLNDKPPVIRIAENDEFRFPSGSAQLSEMFIKRLNGEIFPEILAALKKYANRIDTIEIVGHTDGQPLARSVGNLDAAMVGALHQQAASGGLRPGSNVDLGIMRAMEVRRMLRPWLDENGYSQIQIRCYSAGPGVGLDGNAPPADGSPIDEGRRRIEIRFMGLKTARPPQSSAPQEPQQP